MVERDLAKVEAVGSRPITRSNYAYLLMSNNKKLGRGLSALLGESNINSEHNFESQSFIQNLDINSVKPNPSQPRRNFDLEKIDELASSIKTYGVLQPIIVNKQNDEYIIIAGERRWRASKVAGLAEIPVIIKNINDSEVFKIALIENLQREDLNIIEEIAGYLNLIEVYGYNQEELSHIIGKSRSHITNILRLNKLPDAIKEKLITQELSFGHARALVSADNAVELAEVILSKNLNVRQTEKLIQGQSQKQRNKKITPSKEQVYNNNEKENEDFNAIANNLSTHLNLDTNIFEVEGGANIVKIKCNNLEDLDRIIMILMQSKY